VDHGSQKDSRVTRRDYFTSNTYPSFASRTRQLFWTRQTIQRFSMGQLALDKSWTHEACRNPQAAGNDECDWMVPTRKRATHFTTPGRPCLAIMDPARPRRPEQHQLCYLHDLLYDYRVQAHRDAQVPHVYLQRYPDPCGSNRSNYYQLLAH
jgi:hypothetical protein